MPSKLVTDRDKASRFVASAADAHAAEIAAGFERELAPYLKSGEKLPDVALLVRLAGRRIAADAAALVEADEAHERELGDDAAPRDARDEAALAARSALVDSRAAIDAAFGTPGLKKLGLDQTISQDPSVLATTAAQVAKSLRDTKLKLPKPRRAGFKVDRAALAADIEASLPALKEALADVAREEHEKNLTLRAKQAAAATSDRSFIDGAGWLSATCALAGLTDLAGKIRPSSRRTGTAADDEAETPEQDDEAPEPDPGDGEG